MAHFVMIHLLGLYLLCIHFTKQDSCSAPGNLTAPQMFLNTSSSDEGDVVLVKCKLLPISKFSRVILCKDGKEMKIEKQIDSIFAYNFYYKISEHGAGQISCMFQFKDTNNQVRNSGLSNIKVLGDRRPSHVLNLKSLGISIFAILMLAAVFYLLKERGVIKWSSTKDQHESNIAIEMENQSKDQPTDTLNESDFHGNASHTYAEIASNQFGSSYCHAKKTQETPDMLYTSVTKVKKT
ncbi:uncharacterized protein LOC131198493 isoform X1 [Ahaetulla prasina]|uniref:uncharacterized protein LOC131198493 isoform X1 n=1 Tax=Ahaetulla prasina TaxID=499056 RepID=UPI002649350E|nr:uncharacterized protein LOC131198493 isoform X1 [Ahaetulla prasina]